MVQFAFKFQFLTHFLFPAKFIIGRFLDILLRIIQYMGKICYGRPQKVKSPLVWDFPENARYMKPGFRKFNADKYLKDILKIKN